MDIYEGMSYCGIYCPACKNYKKNAGCMGCRNEKSLVDDCPTRSCAIERGLLHCGQCADYPCKTLECFYNDGNPMHLQARIEMQSIIELGAAAWLEERQKRDASNGMGMID